MQITEWVKTRSEKQENLFFDWWNPMVAKGYEKYLNFRMSWDAGYNAGYLQAMRDEQELRKGRE